MVDIYDFKTAFIHNRQQTTRSRLNFAFRIISHGFKTGDMYLRVRRRGQVHGWKDVSQEAWA
jgi:hypothetical protein